MAGSAHGMTMREWESAQVDRANATTRAPVVFAHGLWLVPSSWDRWAALFEEAGYIAVTAGWPDDPRAVAGADAHPEVFAGRTIGQVADHLAWLIEGLNHKPAVIGHSLGGLLTQILAGRGLAAVSVAIAPAPFRGVLPLPISALRSVAPERGYLANVQRAIPLAYGQFRYAFANAVSEQEAQELYRTFAVPDSGTPIFQAATGNFNPWTDAKVDTENPGRGPLLIISGEMDRTVPYSHARAAYQQQSRNQDVTEFTQIENRGHALTIDSGWRVVADTALKFVRCFT